eukprot:8099126-Lingulodinium_polyedra.AAC.1
MDSARNARPCSTVIRHGAPIVATECVPFMIGMTDLGACDIVLYLKLFVVLRSSHRAGTPTPDAAIAG